MLTESRTETDGPPDCTIEAGRFATVVPLHETSEVITHGYVTGKSVKIDTVTRRRDGKPTLVVLGTRFASWSLLMHIDFDLYRVVIVSPRNYFLFTPLLSSWILDKVDIMSILEPVHKSKPSTEYYQAECIDIDATASLIS